LNAIGGKEFFFLKKKFSEYYSTHLPVPPELGRREFGFGWAKKIDYSHKAFGSVEEFRAFMVSEAPFYASYSTSCYELPGARPMEKKGFLGSDLAFDIDVQPAHGDHNPVMCPPCLERAREDALRLLEEFLCGDFGFSKNEVSANFSGSKGFHLHVFGGAVRQLPASARAQLVDYASAQGLDLARLVTGMGGEREPVRGPGRSARGWGKKIFDYASDFLAHSSLEVLRSAGLGAKAAEKIIGEKELALEKMRGGNWDAVAGLDRLWKKIVPQAVERKRVVVDRSVTIDQARLIRLPDSLHGDTGLVAKKCDLKKFNPLEDAVAFKSGLARVRTEEDLVVPLMDKVFELKAHVPADVPTAVAVLLVCRKKAVLVEEY